MRQGRDGVETGKENYGYALGKDAVYFTGTSSQLEFAASLVTSL